MKKPKNNLRTRTNIFLSVKELEKIKKACSQVSISVSSFLRVHGLKEAREILKGGKF